METPILMLAFNRPDLFEQVFLVVKKAKPKKVYISLDGPRNNQDKEKIQEIKNIIAENSNWNVQIKINEFEENHRGYIAVPKGITWFFQHEEMGIILEDDCLPDLTFFSFCHTLLNKYKYNDKIFSISGNNFQDGNIYGDGSYFMSHYFHVWGWATWRRAWENFDINLSKYPEFVKSKKIDSYFKNKKAKKRILYIMKKAYNGANSFDYKWQMAHMLNDKFTIKPQINLVKNIGFDIRATHVLYDPYLSNLKINKLNEIIIPSNSIPYFQEADEYLAEKHLQPPTFINQLVKLFLLIRKKIKI